MLEKKYLLKRMITIIISIATAALIPNDSPATISSTGYNFEKVEIGFSKSTTISITNLGEKETLITGIVFANTTCSDFFISYIPENKKIPPKGTMEIEISYTPTTIGFCSDTLRIYNGPFFLSMVTFEGTGVEPVEAKPTGFSAQDQALEQIRAILSFVQEEREGGALKGTGKGKSTAQNRIKTFNKMLIIAEHMIENGNIEAAHNKLVTVYKKTDGNPNPEDFVTGTAADSLARQIQDLISSLNSI